MLEQKRVIILFACLTGKVELLKLGKGWWMPGTWLNASMYYQRIKDTTL